MAGKIKSARGPDRVILIAGLLFFVDSFLPWYGVKGVAAVAVRSLGGSPNVKGWSSGGLAVISILLAIAATLFAAMKAGGMQIGGANDGTIYLALGGGAFLFALLRLLTETNFTRYGLYVAIILGAVLAFGGWQKYQGARA
jgi:hypothetical protein